MEHLAAVWDRTGVEPARLRDAPELPVSMLPLWEDFLELHQSRGSTGFGPARIGFADIDAWQRVRGVTLAPWQVDAIRRADEAYLSAISKRGKEQ